MSYPRCDSLKCLKRLAAAGNVPWILDSAEYKAWKHGSRGSMLWITGAIGTGKSVAVAKIIKDLYQSENGGIITYVFCQPGMKWSLRTRDIVSAIARQIHLESGVRQSKYVNEKVLGRSTLTVGLALRCFIAHEYDVSNRPIRIFIDGLDYLPEFELREMLDGFIKLCMPFVHFLISRRRKVSAGEMSSESTCCWVLNLDSEEHDRAIRAYVKSKSFSRSRSQSLSRKSLSKVVSIGEAIVANCQRTYFMADVLLELMVQRHLDKSSVAAIENFPNELERFYKRLWENFKLYHSADDIEKQKKLMLINLAARSRLHADEIQEALRIDLGDGSLNVRSTGNGLEEIVDLFCGLLKIDRDKEELYFVHPSAETYFLEALGFDGVNLSRAHCVLAAICMKYLQSERSECQHETFGDGSWTISPFQVNGVEDKWSTLRRAAHFSRMPSLVEEEEKSLAESQEMPFYGFAGYAADNWFDCSRFCFIPKHDQHGRLYNKAAAWYTDVEGLIKRVFGRFIAQFHRSVSEQTVPSEASSKDFSNKWCVDAVRHNHLTFLNFLLSDFGSEISVGSIHRACFAAARRGNVDALKVLMHYGAGVNIKHSTDWSLLSVAAHHGRFEVAKLLIEHGAEVDLKLPGGKGRTALFSAAVEGHSEVVRLLLICGASVDIKRDGGWTALIGAARRGRTETAKLLLEYGADVSAKTDNGTTALMLAVERADVSMVELLLE